MQLDTCTVVSHPLVVSARMSATVTLVLKQLQNRLLRIWDWEVRSGHSGRGQRDSNEIAASGQATGATGVQARKDGRAEVENCTLALADLAGPQAPVSALRSTLVQRSRSRAVEQAARDGAAARIAGKPELKRR